MTGLITKVDIDWIVEIGQHSEVEVNMERIIGEDHNMSILIDMTLKKCKIIEVKILEVDIEIITEMTILEEAEIGLERGLGGMIEAVAVD